MWTRNHVDQEPCGLGTLWTGGPGQKPSECLVYMRANDCPGWTPECSWSPCSLGLDTQVTIDEEHLVHWRQVMSSYAGVDLLNPTPPMLSPVPPRNSGHLRSPGKWTSLSVTATGAEESRSRWNCWWGVGPRPASPSLPTQPLTSQLAAEWSSLLIGRPPPPPWGNKTEEVRETVRTRNCPAPAAVLLKKNKNKSCRQRQNVAWLYKNSI